MEFFECGCRIIEDDVFEEGWGIIPCPEHIEKKED